MKLKAHYLALFICSSYPSIVQAQIDPAGISPPTVKKIDANGVDLSTGRLALELGSIAIGPNGPGGLGYVAGTDKMVQRSDVFGYIQNQGNKYLVVFGGDTSIFTLTGALGTGTFAPDVADGSSLSYDSATGSFTHTARDGTVSVFQASASGGSLQTTTFPNGIVLKYYYYSQPPAPGATYSNVPLKSITSSLGYQLWLDYSSAQYGSQILAYVSRAVVFNNGSEVCDPNGLSCSLTGVWPTLNISNYGGTVTDNLGRTTSIVANGGYNGTWVLTLPSGRQANILVGQTSYQGIPDYSVSSYSDGRGTWRYNHYSGNITLRFGPDHGAPDQYQFGSAGLTGYWPGSTANPGYFYSYDAQNRLAQSRIGSASGGGIVTQYTYDARGNITRKEVTSATPGTPANIVVTANYPVTCANIKVCNRPTSVTDARGQVTDYDYDPGTGYVTSVTAPGAVAGGPRAKTTLLYQSLQAYYKNAGGAVIASGLPVSLPVSRSTCQTSGVTSASQPLPCLNTADEVRSTISYGPQSNGVANNLLPVTTTAGAGDDSVSATTTQSYDSVGRLLTVDGPLPGTDDTIRYRYDAAGQLVGVVQPDPDGSGPRVRAAKRVTYNADGQEQLAEIGTVTDQSDAAWANFSSAQQTATSYDAQGNAIKSELRAGGTTYAVANTDYTAGGMVTCTAIRMNPATFASLPVSACTPAATGAAGPDRITQYTYDAIDRPLTLTFGVGTSDASTVTKAYDGLGNLASVIDGENNKTAYSYDGFDRLSATYYPSPTQGAGTTNAGDYEQLTYDANGNVTNRRLRDGSSISYTYDNLNRLTFKDRPNIGYWETDLSYGYDLLGRITSASHGNGLSYGFSYDALGRRKGDSNSWYGYGNFTLGYDAAGRLARLTWGDGFYVTYDHLVTGEVTAIKENGSVTLATYAYDDLGRRTSLTRGNGVVTSYGYDNASELTSLSHDLAGTARDVTTTFAYGPSGQLASSTRSNDAYAWPGSVNVDRSYGVNGLNQLTSAGATGLGYDGKGNLNVSGSTSYGYSSENELTQSSTGGYYAYDPFNRLFAENIPGSDTTFQYDGSQLLTESSGIDGSFKRRYVYGPGDDEPLVWYEGAGTTDKRWLVADERGSVVAVTDASGNTIATNTYDEYGIPGAGNIGRFQYTGQKWLPELGMYDYKARMYSPTLGRFMQTDPIGYADGTSWYNYVGSDPINATDPSGTECYGGPYGGQSCSNVNYSDNARSYVDSNGQIGHYYGNGGDVYFRAGNFNTSDFGNLSGVYLGDLGRQNDIIVTANRRQSPLCNNAAAVAFVKAHQAAAAALAASNGNTAAEILGLSLAEVGPSGNTLSRTGNNYFSLEGKNSAKLPFATGTGRTSGGATFATYSSYYDSGRSFLSIYGSAVAGITDPTAFAQALVTAGYNSGSSSNGGTSGFVANTASVIRSAATRMGCR